MGCCISFESYIKPQQNKHRNQANPSCISFESYIKPQLSSLNINYMGVVYLLNPTSNHNCKERNLHNCNVVYLLNPTSNHNSAGL